MVAKTRVYTLLKLTVHRVRALENSAISHRIASIDVSADYGEETFNQLSVESARNTESCC